MNAIVTIAIGVKYSELAKLTHPSIKAYAERVGAEFIVIDKPSENPHWEKMQLYNMLVKYNRIIYLDTDLIVRDDCPDFFDLVPEEQLGIFNEGRFANRSGSLQEAYQAYRKPFPEKWDGTYYNTGVMVLSRRHRQLFKMPERVFNLGMFEQGYLNMKILEMDNNKEKEERVYELDFRHNRMQLTDDYCGIHRCDSYIVHYAGAPEQVDVPRLIKKDLQDWENKYPDYKYEREIVIYMGGGMGDQLGAEPVARFAMEKMFKDVKTNFVILTNWPRFFTHLGVPCMIREDYEAQPRYDTPVKILKTIPAPYESTLWQHWSHISGHTLDYAAISTLHRILPDEDREIKLQASIEGLTEILDISGSANGELVLVHPGKGWASKTFPAEWWEEVICGLQAEGKKVGIIGKRIDNDQGYVDIMIPEGVIDFRDILSLDGLIALIATSCLLISNDSAPIHIAGAFDNNILMIATCKHPDYVLPYRKGTKTYKTFAFKKKLTIDDWDLSPTQIFKESADVVKGNILDYLPEPFEVVEKAIEMIGTPKEAKAASDNVMDFMAEVTKKKSNTPIKWSEDYEPEVSAFMRKTLKQGDNFIDVGANFGIFTMLAAELVGDGHVYAFEPEKNTFEALRGNVNANNFRSDKNIHLFDKAVGEKDGEAILYFNLDNDGGHALWNPAHHPLNKATQKCDEIVQGVEVMTLDSLPDVEIKLIKIDTEGCELKVLKGAEALLKKYKPAVISEINSFALKEMGTSKEELVEYMESLGYKIYSLPDEREIDVKELDGAYLNTNVVFM